MKNKPALAPYVLLIFVAVISMSYYLAGAVALREEFFHAGQYVREPFDFRNDGQTVTALQKEATAAGFVRQYRAMSPIAATVSAYSGSSDFPEESRSEYFDEKAD